MKNIIQFLHRRSLLLLTDDQVLGEPSLVTRLPAQHILRFFDQIQPLLHHLNIDCSPNLVESCHDLTDDELLIDDARDQETDDADNEKSCDLCRIHLIDAFAAARESAQRESQGYDEALSE